MAVKIPAVGGRANAACSGEALAAALEIPRSAVWMAPDSRDRRKLVQAYEDPADLTAQLESLASRG